MRNRALFAIFTSMSIGSIAQTGLLAAGKRLEASANNVANVSSTVGRDATGALKNEPYRAQRVEQTSLLPAGVGARIVDAQKPTIRVADASNVVADEDGTVEAPNVSLDEEAVQQNIAGYDLKANLKVFKAQDEMIKQLVDLQA